MRRLPTAAVIVLAVAGTVAVMWAVAVASSTTLLETVAQLGPVATALTAIVALIVGIGTIRQRQQADALDAQAQRRDQWWQRAQWAIDRLYEPPEDRQLVSWRILGTLAESELAGPEELAILRAVAVRRLRPDDPARPSAQLTEPSGPVAPSAIDAAAAQLWTAAERRLGGTAPEWVRRLTPGPSPPG